jgi:hypothetical protein
MKVLPVWSVVIAMVKKATSFNPRQFDSLKDICRLGCQDELGAPKKKKNHEESNC